VSRTVGTPSVAGVDTGEDWAVIAGRAGMYIFDGGEPVKISQEIQPLWDQINWAAGQTLWVRVDTRNKRIRAACRWVPPHRPIASWCSTIAAFPTRVNRVAGLRAVLYVIGKLYAVGRSRKWCPWKITANSCTLAERSTAPRKYFWGTDS